MYKKSVSLLVVFLLVLSPLTLAANETDTCTGFLNTLKCFFFGDPSSRPVAGAAWHDRGLPWYEPEGESLVGNGYQNV